jgi:hypothetical protein
MVECRGKGGRIRRTGYLSLDGYLLVSGSTLQFRHFELVQLLHHYDRRKSTLCPCN